jgi:hypothetical protein
MVDFEGIATAAAPAAGPASTTIASTITAHATTDTVFCSSHEYLL